MRQPVPWVHLTYRDVAQPHDTHVLPAVPQPTWVGQATQRMTAINPRPCSGHGCALCLLAK